MITEPIQSEASKTPYKKYKKNYGSDVYASSGISIPVYVVLLIVLLIKIWKGELPLDPTLVAAIVTPLVFNVQQAINMMRIQWQTNKAHQRVNKIKDDKEKSMKVEILK